MKKSDLEAPLAIAIGSMHRCKILWKSRVYSYVWFDFCIRFFMVVVGMMVERYPEVHRPPRFETLLAR